MQKEKKKQDGENKSTLKHRIDFMLDGLANKPHCDIETGKIYNCKEGTKEYLHEKAHIIFNNLPFTSTLRMWQGVANLLWMFSITLAIYNKYMMIIALPMLLLYIGVDVFEEYCCNKYAKANFKG